MNLIGKNIYISDKAQVADDVTIYHGAFIGDGVIVGKGTIIYQNAVVLSSSVGEDCIIGQFSLTRDSKINNNVTVGPYSKVGESQVRDRGVLSHNCSITHTILEEEAHLGAGVIVIPGIKQETDKNILKRNCKIGANVTLTTPITIGENAIIGANSLLANDIQNDITYIQKQDIEIKKRNNKLC